MMKYCRACKQTKELFDFDVKRKTCKECLKKKEDKHGL